MLRQILKPTDSRLVLELPPELVGHEIEILAFALDSPPTTNSNIAESDILNFANMLKDSPNFNGDLVEWQREQRDEWR
jgi:hypothetical protein